MPPPAAPGKGYGGREGEKGNQGGRRRQRITRVRYTFRTGMGIPYPLLWEPRGPNPQNILLLHTQSSCPLPSRPAVQGPKPSPHPGDPGLPGLCPCPLPLGDTGIQTPVLAPSATQAPTFECI